MTEKILVIGLGFLGKNIAEQFTEIGTPVTGTNYSKPTQNTENVDITKIDSIKKCVSKIKPSIIINCAANTKVDFLEQNSELAFSINSYGAENVAKVSKEFNAKLIQISTDSVFDGNKGMYSEDDKANPINIYGQSKFLGEKLVSENCDNYVIVRTNFYGYEKNGNFLFNWILKNLRSNQEIVGFDDILFTPLEVRNLSQQLHELISKDFVGILNLSSDEQISKFQFAMQVAENLNLNKDLIKKGNSSDMNFIAKRPKNTSLSNNKAKKILNTKIISLSQWLSNNKQLLMS